MRHVLKTAALSLAFALSVAAGAAPAQTSVSASPSAAHGGTFALDPAHSKITWEVNHFGFSTYIGQFATVNGVMKLDPKALGATALDVTVDTGSLGTLNPALDTHVKSKDFLDVAAFPTATFHATRVVQTGERTADITGDLTLHGVTRPVTVQATFNQSGSNPVDKAYRLGFAGAAKLNRSEFGVKSYVPAIGDEVTLIIQAEFREQPAT